ncbi:FG-GAP repeat domain-containing protein [Streptomyces sp. NPDC033754]
MRARTCRGRIGAAIAVTVTVTAGGLAGMPAAVAAVSDTAVTTMSQAVPTLPEDSQLVGNGPSGFLTRTGHGQFSWTRYKDGVTTALPRAYEGTVRSDTIVASSGTTYSLYDMATGGPSVDMDLAFLGTGTHVKGLVGNNLIVNVPRADGGNDVHLVSKRDGTTVDRTIAGLPTDVRSFSANVDSPDTLTLLYTRTVDGVPGTRVALVDVATATVAEDRAAPEAGLQTDVTTSATHLAWVEKTAAANGAVALGLARWGEPGFRRIPLGYGSRVQAELMGDWLTYTETGGDAAASPNPLHALTARSLTTGQTVKVLDTVATVRSQADDELLVHGGTIEQGQGIYRITPGLDGSPTATLVASTGKPTALSVVSEEVPETVGFGSPGSKARLAWQFGRWGARVQVELTHDASGKRWTAEPAFLDSDHRAFVEWTGLFDNSTAAYNGTYTWRMTATPLNGIGPVVRRSGTLKAASRTAPHDYSDSGTPDLLVRSSAGHLSSFDVQQLLSGQGPWEQTDRGGGWNTYDRLVATGDLAGSAYADVLGRDRSGVLWLYQGTGHSLASRTNVGGGWQIYDRLAAGSDLTGDGRPDLVATDKSGYLWLYQATGNAKAPFATRKRIGGGWGVYNQITATGNIGGGPAGDLVARDTSGVLWLYLGRGDGTFAGRTRIGSGWNTYTDLVGIGDVDKDGRPDLIAVNRKGDTTGTLFLYKGTGDWHAPFAKRTAISSWFDFENNSNMAF